MKICKCGNKLDELKFKMVIHPCRCKAPGKEHHAAPDMDKLSYIPKRQYEQRTRLGLPVEADIEKSSRIPWH